MATVKEKLDSALLDVEALKTALKDKEVFYQGQVGKLEDKVKSLVNSLEYKEKKLTEAVMEVETLHEVFDFLPNCLGRHTAEGNSWDRKSIPVIARLCSFLANIPPKKSGE
jgi:SMC interacting uncharacterized protein involved in chromosome segregation